MGIWKWDQLVVVVSSNLSISLPPGAGGDNWLRRAWWRRMDQKMPLDWSHCLVSALNIMFSTYYYLGIITQQMSFRYQNQMYTQSSKVPWSTKLYMPLSISTSSHLPSSRTTNLPTLRIPQHRNNNNIIHRRLRIQQRLLTMQRMLVIVQMAIDVPPHRKRPMHLSPHESAVGYVVLPVDIESGITLQCCGGVDCIVAIGGVELGVEFPVIKGQEVVH